MSDFPFPPSVKGLRHGLHGRRGAVALSLLLWALPLPDASAASAQDDTLRMMFWNLENFFDWRDDGTCAADAEFSAQGKRNWTQKRFYAKCDAVSKAILWTADAKGALPDVIGVAEVENAFVLRRLIQSTPLAKREYGYVHFDSHDPRGIDVALLYRKDRLRLLEAKPCHQFSEKGTVLRTRDILLVRFNSPQGPVSVLVNHHPSKYGGPAASAPRRRRAVLRLRFLVDSLASLGERHIVAMGDFNDTSDQPVYHLLEPSLHDLSRPLLRRGEGSIRFNGRWDLIDLFFVSPALHQGGTRMDVLHIPFLQVSDKGRGGVKPLRTYSGPRYLGGVSDHCPIWLVLPPPSASGSDPRTGSR